MIFPRIAWHYLSWLAHVHRYRPQQQLPAVLLRQSSRVGHKIVKRTLANLSDWPATQVDLLRRVLKGEALVSVSEVLEIERSLPHGHVAAALGTLRHIGLESDVARSSAPQRDLVCALIVARMLTPASQPATARGLREQTASSSLGTLGLELVDEDHLYEAMDGLLSRQARIEDKLAGPICKKDRWCSTMSPRFTSKAVIVR